jgi:DegV family protein with EDD domain
MKKYAMVIDSTVYLTKEMIEENNISVVSLNVVDGVDSYREVDVDVDFIYEKQDSGTQWTTSQPAPGDFLETFQKLIDQGYEKILCVLLSQNISGTFQSANLAKNMLDNPEIVHIFDTQLCAYGTEMIGIEVVEMMQQKKPVEEIIDRITKVIATSGQMFTVENLFSLVKGGRLSATRAAIGTVLRIKPIIKVIDGKLQLVKSERTYKKVHKFFLENINQTLEGREKITFYVTSQNSLEATTQIKNLLEETYPGCKLTFTQYLGPVFSIHVGKKGYGISWFSE